MNMKAVCGDAAPQRNSRTTPPGKLGFQRSSWCRFPSSEGAAYESERSTTVPLSYRADGTPERVTFQSEASERISFDSIAYGTPLAEPPGRWTFGSEASTAPNVPRAGCWGCPPRAAGCPPPPMCCPSDPVPYDVNVHDRRAVASPEVPSSDYLEEYDLPSKITLYPDTDDEGEPQVKFAWELWPVAAPKPKRNYALLGTRPREAKQQAAGQAAPPVVVRRPPGIHTFPVAKGTAAAPATATRTPPPGIHSALVARETLAASATATHVVMAKSPVTAPTAPPETWSHAAHEGKASQKARRANQPRITTLVVRNLHLFATQQEFLDEVNRSGFAEKYDYAYLPRNFEDGSGKGHAFINFKTAEAANTFTAAWHRSRRPYLSTVDEAGEVAPLNVSNATLQGVEANLRKWTDARVTRVKNPDYLPFVLRGAEPEPQTPWPEATMAVAIAVTKPR